MYGRRPAMQYVCTYFYVLYIPHHVTPTFPVRFSLLLLLLLLLGTAPLEPHD